MTKTESIEQLREEMDAISWWHTQDLGDGLVTPGQEPGNGSRDPYLRIPEDLTGKIVLDVGAWDGKYSFRAEKRGADSVVALDPDTKDRSGILFAKKVLGSSVHVRYGDIETEDFTDWADVIFCFGVLYHLKHGPMLALERMFTALVPGGLLIVETALASINLSDSFPMLEFVEGERGGDPTNWWYPNRACMEAMLRATGFVDVEYTGGVSGRGAWHAKKP